MNKAKLKSYAPQARLDFIAAVTARANLLGLSAKSDQLEVAPAQTQGDVTVIAGQAWPSKVNGQRERLIDRIKRDGFEQTCEAIAYTWFNRFAALRYMELHDYLGHGHRALSSASGALPDILTYAADLANAGDSGLPGLKAEVVTEMKLAGNRDGELYRMLLVAQCNALSRAMPFLFERIDDDSELLLPDNLLRSDSVIAKLVLEIPEDDWAEVEIIGWLYQFYISEKKDQVIGKVVKSEDIPAATQLFTPNWIVQYLVQNSVGRLWLMANPQSTLAKEWPYYITPAEQTPEVQAQLDALIQTRVREDGDTLNPESITVLDPACGSGHILVVAYDVIKAIYLERGYQPRAIPRLILEKNLYGLDIDDRAAQMAGFAVLMKARADDRRLFTTTDDAGNLLPPKLNVMSLQESKGLNADDLATHLTPFKVPRANITALVETFEQAKTFGSLIQIPDSLKKHLDNLSVMLARARQDGDMYATAAADDLLLFVKQAQVLAMQFDAVVANPPYMGTLGFNEVLREFMRMQYSSAKSDLFAAFISRSFEWLLPSGYSSTVTMQSWMFLDSFQNLRSEMITSRQLNSLIQMDAGVMIGFGTVASVLQCCRVEGFQSVANHVALNEINEEDLPSQWPTKSPRNRSFDQRMFESIPGNPFAFWCPRPVLTAFEKGNTIANLAPPKKGLITSNNARFLRHWYEPSLEKIDLQAVSRSATKNSGKKWFAYNCGGEFRKWYGNNYRLINWENDGVDIIQYASDLYGSASRQIQNTDFYFKPCITWSNLTSSFFGARISAHGHVFGGAGSAAFPNDTEKNFIAGFFNSKVSWSLLQLLNPTLNFTIGNIASLPVLDLDPAVKARVSKNVAELFLHAKSDWDSVELSWSFQRCPLLFDGSINIHIAWTTFEEHISNRIKNTIQLEEENNQIFINAYGLQDELTSEVPESQITLARADREKDSQRLISYAIGCMMGRYSLDEPGLVYAHARNVGFEPGRYKIFPADADGIVPITDELWFEDDAVLRIREFLLAVWGEDTLEENLAWLAESLGSKATETPEETIRRYVADKFFKDHLQTYKKRPIYWLFSSGKQGAFQALVYLHRYHEGTLSRMRAEYVVPLTSKIQSRIEMLQKDMASASSTAARNKLTKEVEKLKKKHVELLAYDEQLRHYADMRIKLDLDDGVKVNYGKFGDLLAEVKAVTGGASDE